MLWSERCGRKNMFVFQVACVVGLTSYKHQPNGVCHIGCHKVFLWIYVNEWVHNARLFEWKLKECNVINCINDVCCFLAATKQLYDLFSPSVCPSVCLSICHTFFTMFPSSYHHEIFRNYYQWQKWRPWKRSRSKVKVTEVNTQLNRFRTVTPVWIHIWW